MYICVGRSEVDCRNQPSAAYFFVVVVGLLKKIFHYIRTQFY